MEFYGKNKEYITKLINASVENLCEVNKNICKGNLGIARKDMPQIPSHKMEEFLKELEKKGIKVKRNKYVMVKDIQPAQNELDADKIDNLIKNPILDKPILISNCNHVADGTHRFAALFITNPNSNILVNQVDLPIMDLIKEAHDFDGSEKRDLEGNKVANLISQSIKDALNANLQRK